MHLTAFGTMLALTGAVIATVFWGGHWMATTTESISGIARDVSATRDTVHDNKVNATTLLQDMRKGIARNEAASSENRTFIDVYHGKRRPSG